MKLNAHAKINWDLRVLGKRPDGFHELDSIFASIDLKDELVFKKQSCFELTCSNPKLSCSEDNLIVKAARALASAAGRPAEAHIHLHKQIPMGGGLGGGSSDAATTLLGLNQLWDLNWSIEKLASIAARLGSDIAYFLTGGWCRCRGRGEIVETLPERPAWNQLRIFLVIPPAHVPTPDVYRHLNVGPLNSGKIGMRTLTDTVQELSLAIESLKKDGSTPYRFTNDLLKAARRVEPRLIATGNALQRIHPDRWQMSGSGAVHYLIPEPSARLNEIKEQIESLLPFDVSVVEARTLNRPCSG